MKAYLSTKWRVMLVAGTLAGLGGATVFAAKEVDLSKIGGHPVKAAAKPVKTRVKLEEKDFEVQKRPAIPFKPLEMRDQNGKALAANSMIPLPNGKKITARAYFDQLNSLEKKLNAIGYSLRDKPRKAPELARIKVNTGGRDNMMNLKRKIEGDHQKLNQIKVARINDKDMKQVMMTQFEKAKATEVKLEAQRKEVHAKLKTVDVSGLSPAHRNVIQAAAAKAALTKADLQAVTKIVKDPNNSQLNRAFVNELAHLFDSQNVDWSKKWYWGIGDPSVAEAHIKGDLSVHGQYSIWDGMESSKLHGDLEAGGYVLKNGITVFSLNGDTSADKNGAMRVQISASALGNTLVNYDKSGAAWFYEDPDPWTFDIDIVDASFPVLGVLSLDVSVHIKGDAGMRYGGFVAPSYTTTRLKPYFHSSLYAMGALSLEVLRGGVRGNLTLLNDELELWGKLGVEPDDTTSLHLEYSGYNTMEMLSGQIEAFAQYWAPFSWHDIGSVPLIRWDAPIKVDGYLFNGDQRIALK